MTPYEIDPFTIPIEQKAELLFKTNEEALRVKGVRFVTSSINSIRESRLLGTTEGSLIQQTVAPFPLLLIVKEFCHLLGPPARMPASIPRA